METLDTAPIDVQNDAETQWPDDRAWEALDGKLSVGVWRRLMFAKRSLYAANRIQEMLLEHHLIEEFHDGKPGRHARLRGIDVEALKMAAIELGSRAEEPLTEVQDDTLGCCGPKRGSQP